MSARPKFFANGMPADKPLPLWILYPLFFVVVYLSHWALLRLPFFWDEAGYYIPAALDVFLTGSLVPHSTVTNAHPPIPSLLLAAWWHLSGFVISGTRTFICMVAAAALLGVFRLARLLAGTPIAISVAAITAVYPVWFAQSTLAHADIFAAAFTLWALSFYVERYIPAALRENDQAFHSRDGVRIRLSAAILFSFAALSKETAIITPLALGLWETVQLLTKQRHRTEKAQDPRARHSEASLAWVVILFVPALPLALWYLYHYHETGFIFGNPEFLRYNATANLSLLRVLVSLWHRFVHLFVHMNMYVPVVAAVAALVLPRIPNAHRRSLLETRRDALTALVLVIVGNAIAFSILGGALLTRYLLPLYPLVHLFCVVIWRQRIRRWWWLCVLTATAFLAGLFINPPYAFAPEDNLTYRDLIVLHQHAIRIIVTKFPDATVLTAWPATAELQHPYLGYARQPIRVAAIDNFSLEEIKKAAANPDAFDTALIFSTKWAPAADSLNLGHTSEPTDTRFFDFHRDQSPQDVAARLHGQIIWQDRSRGEWAAVLRFPQTPDTRPVESRLLH